MPDGVVALAGAGVDLVRPRPVRRSTSPPRNNRIRIPSRKILSPARAAPQRGRGQGPDRARRARHARPTTRPSGVENWVKTFQRDGVPAAGPGREHRRRRPRDGPAAGRDRPAVGRHRRLRGRRLLPGHLPRARRRRGPRRRRRAGQGDHRPDRPRALQRLAATPSTPAPTGTPTSATGRSTPTCCSPWWPPPARPWSSRRRAASRGRRPTSPGCASACRPDRRARGQPTQRPAVKVSTPSAISGAATVTYAGSTQPRRCPASTSSSHSGNHSSVARATDR